MTRRIALISSSYTPHLGGVEEHVRSTARELKARGAEVVVWTVDRGERLGVQSVDGIEVRYLPTPLPARAVTPIARFAAGFPGAWLQWRQAFRDFRPDVLNVQCFGPNGLYAWLLHRRYGTPLVVSSHGETFADDHDVFAQSDLIRHGFTRALRDAAVVTGVSSVVLEDLRRFGLEGGVVVPNGVDLTAVPSERAPEAGPVPVIFALGRLEHNKGFDLLVRAFAESGLAAHARLVIAGDGGAGESLAQLAADLGVSHRTHFPGRLGTEDVTALMRRASVVVVPSRVEAFGIVALEAWRAGTPLVMTDRGGARDFVNDEVDALLVDPTRTRDLAAAIKRVLDDPEKAHSLVKAGSAAVRNFTWARVAEHYDTVFDEILEALPRPRVAIAHDYLTQRGGAERVVLAMLRAFPDAAIHTTLYDPEGTFPEFRQARIITSPLNRVARLRRDHRAALPLLPYAVSRLPIDADVVIASSSGWAHGVPTAGRKLVYCHAPARWLYQTDSYLGGSATASAKGWVVLALRPWLRRWDRRAAMSADRYVVNSTVVRERVRAAYGLEADVLPPPFGVEENGPQSPIEGLGSWAPDGFHLVVSRLLPYKNVDRVIEAFRPLPERLVIIGEGPLEPVLRGQLPTNVRLVTGLEDAQMRWAYACASALIAPSFEDFGLTPLEAAAFGKPTLALRAGGYLDTIAENVSGAFFERATAEDIRCAVIRNRDRSWDPEAIKRHAQTFSEERFHERLREEVECVLGTRPPGWQSRAE